MDTDRLTAKAEIMIRRPAKEVFDAFADPELMSRFWFTRRDDGLKEGESVLFYIGDGDDAFSFEARVRELERPNKIVIDWGTDDEMRRVTWSIEEPDDGSTLLRIEEAGFSGEADTVIDQVLDSTCGFNQVIIAAKALIEHGVDIHVVADHA